MKNIYVTALSCLAVLTVVGLRYTTTPQSSSPSLAPVNAVIGDESYLVRYGTSPKPETPDSLRIRAHLEYVLSLLDKDEPLGMPDAKLKQRAQLLGHLADYIETGRFPHNDGHPDARRPTFIDATGAICAVGYLVEMTAGREVAERVASTFKYAFIPEIDDPTFLAWADASGFTMQELAMIQPAYDGWQPETRHYTYNDNHVEPAYKLGTFMLVSMQGLYWGGVVAPNADPRVGHVIGFFSGMTALTVGYANRDNKRSENTVPNCITCHQPAIRTKTNHARTGLSATHMIIGGATMIRSAIGLAKIHRDAKALERHRIDVVGLQPNMISAEPVPALSWKMRF